MNRPFAGYLDAVAFVCDIKCRMQTSICRQADRRVGSLCRGHRLRSIEVINVDVNLHVGVSDA